MERRLILMRHAKSSWKTGAETDHERPLNKRGRHDAPRVARRLVELGWAPAAVISSDSTRTRETWALMADELDDPLEAVFEPSLYLAGLGAIQDAAAGVGDDVSPLLTLGHNPGCEEAVAWLSGKLERITTANAALLSYSPGEDPWSEALAQPGRWTLEAVIRPKELPEDD